MEDRLMINQFERKNHELKKSHPKSILFLVFYITNAVDIDNWQFWNAVSVTLRKSSLIGSPIDLIA